MTKFSITRKSDNSQYIDNAFLVDLADETEGEKIIDITQHERGLIVIKNKGNHLSVHLMEKQNGRPQHTISFWVEVDSSITDSITQGRLIGLRYFNHKIQ